MWQSTIGWKFKSIKLMFFGYNLQVYKNITLKKNILNFYLLIIFKI